MESQGQVSPDGTWMAYYSNAAHPLGSVYVGAFPSGARVGTIDVNDAREPRWSRDGTRLYFKTGLPAPDLYEVAVSRDPDGTPHFGAPRRLASRLGAGIVPKRVGLRRAPGRQADLPVRRSRGRGGWLPRHQRPDQLAEARGALLR